MPNDKNNPKAKRIPTVEETNAALEKEFAGIDSKGKDPLSKSGTEALESSMQTSPSKAEKIEETLSEVNAMGSEKRPLHEPKGSYFPTDSLETDENTRKVRTNLLRTQKDGFKSHSYSLMTSKS